MPPDSRSLIFINFKSSDVWWTSYGRWKCYLIGNTLIGAVYSVYKMFFQLVAKCWVLFILEFLCICKSVSKYSLSSYIYIYKFDYVTKNVHIPVKFLTCCVFLNWKDPSWINCIMDLLVKLVLKNVNTCTVASSYMYYVWGLLWNN